MAGLFTRSATPDAFARTLALRCPQCGTRLVRDDYGVWCKNCLWCGTCAGRGCTFCPQKDEYRGFGDAPPPPRRECETCQGSPRLGTSPQCQGCLWYHIPPAEVAPFVGKTSEVIRYKRLQWLLRHRGWVLSPNRSYIIRQPGTKDEPFGRQLLLVEYRVERGYTGVV